MHDNHVSKLGSRPGCFQYRNLLEGPSDELGDPCSRICRWHHKLDDRATDLSSLHEYVLSIFHRSMHLRLATVVVAITMVLTLGALLFDGFSKCE